MRILVAGRLQESEETETKTHGVDALLLMAFEKRKLLDAVLFVGWVVWMMEKSGGLNLTLSKN